MTGACLDDNDAAEFASGAMRGAAQTKIETHLAACRDCRALVAALAPAPGSAEADSDIITAPQPARLPRGKRRRDVGLDATIPRSPHEPEITVGDTIGRYVILARLGAGGMGVVWTAYDPQLDRKVAIKLLRAGSGVQSSEGRARLVREAQAIAQLSHPNVVAVYDVGTAESGEVYIAMEFVEGETLTSWLAKWERTWREALDVFLQAGRGLAAAHAVGLLHRDFKPDNVLVGTDGRVRVTDFGLARSFITTPGDDAKQTPAPTVAALRVTLTATGTVLGTPRYMAPEQVRGRDTDARSDQFSFCVAMYESLYGKHPLPGDTAAEMVEQGGRAQPAPDGPVPASIGRALVRGLEMEPVRRWPSMQTLLHELTPPPVRTRERILVAGLGGLLLVGAAGAAVMATGSSSSTPPPSIEILQLKEHIQQLERERDEYIREIEKYKHDASKLEELKKEIVDRDTKIIELTDKLAAATTGIDGGVPAIVVHAKPPPPPRAKGVTLDIARDVAETLDLARCFEAVPGTSRMDFTAQIMVTPEGKSHLMDLAGVEDGAPTVCVRGRFNGLDFPPTTATTTITFGVHGEGATFTVTPRIDAVSDGEGQLDTNDLQRP